MDSSQKFLTRHVRPLLQGQSSVNLSNYSPFTAYL